MAQGSSSIISYKYMKVPQANESFKKSLDTSVTQNQLLNAKLKSLEIERALLQSSFTL